MKRQSKLVISIVGARPQFVKVAPFCIASATSMFRHEIIHTGQHYDYEMSQIFFEQLSIKAPLMNLDIGSGSHGEQTGRMLEKLDNVYQDLRPDYVVVYGDTNSTLAASLAASKLSIPIAHAEAGQRSYRREMPEEINRIITDLISSTLFTTGELASNTLLEEGRSREDIVQTGDLMYDAFLLFRDQLFPSKELLYSLPVQDEFILSTFHRAENTDSMERLRIVVEALAEISHFMKVIIPMHPRTKAMLEKFDLLLSPYPNITVINAVSYRDMLELLLRCSLVITDSGGLQKEAYFAGKPSVILRKETEWEELSSSRWARLTSESDSESIVREVSTLREEDLSGLERNPQWFGQGDSAKKMVHALEAKLQ